MRRLHLIEDSLSVFALLAMATLPLLEIVLRKAFSIGIPGSAVWVQHLTLWIGFLGAAVAARRGELLSLTVGPSLLRGKAKKAAEILAAGVGVAVCSALAYGSLQLVIAEREGGSLLALGLPVWVAESIMPVGFSVIGLRILWRVPYGWSGRAITASFVFIPILLWAFEDLPGHGIWLPLFLVLIIAIALGARNLWPEPEGGASHHPSLHLCGIYPGGRRHSTPPGEGFSGPLWLDVRRFGRGGYCGVRFFYKLYGRQWGHCFGHGRLALSHAS